MASASDGGPLRLATRQPRGRLDSRLDLKGFTEAAEMPPPSAVQVQHSEA